MVMHAHKHTLTSRNDWCLRGRLSRGLSQHIGGHTEAQVLLLPPDDHLAATQSLCMSGCRAKGCQANLKGGES